MYAKVKRCSQGVSLCVVIYKMVQHVLLRSTILCVSIVLLLICDHELNTDGKPFILIVCIIKQHCAGWIIAEYDYQQRWYLPVSVHLKERQATWLSHARTIDWVSSWTMSIMADTRQWFEIENAVRSGELQIGPSLSPAIKHLALCARRALARTYHLYFNVFRIALLTLHHAGYNC